MELPLEISHEIIARAFADYLNSYIARPDWPPYDLESGDRDEVHAIIFLSWTGGRVRAVTRKLLHDALGIDEDIITG